MKNFKILYKLTLAFRANSIYTPINRNESARRFAAADGKGCNPSRPAHVDTTHIHNSFRYTTWPLYDDLPFSASVINYVVGCVALTLAVYVKVIRSIFVSREGNPPIPDSGFGGEVLSE